MKVVSTSEINSLEKFYIRLMQYNIHSQAYVSITGTMFTLRNRSIDVSTFLKCVIIKNLASFLYINIIVHTEYLINLEDKRLIQNKLKRATTLLITVLRSRQIQEGLDPFSRPY